MFSEIFRGFVFTVGEIDQDQFERYLLFEQNSCHKANPRGPVYAIEFKDHF
jgi:hypothetical protein